MNVRTPAYLTLSNGMQLQGESMGAEAIQSGEMVFTTGMVGYTKTLTDPSYFGQILVFTFPLMGNYGVLAADDPNAYTLRAGFESRKIHASGVIVSSSSDRTYHWKSHQNLNQWLKDQGIPGITGLDTRHLTQVIRSSSGLLGQIHNGTMKPGEPGLTTTEKTSFYDPNSELVVSKVSTPQRRVLGKGSRRVAVIDCGVKWNIVRQLLNYGCEVELLPWDTDFTQIDCSAWLISNGPGDPQKTGTLISRLQTLLTQDRPILGICLGFQLLALASGAKTRKLEFGHRGHNQPVREVDGSRGFITSQNHGFVVLEETLPPHWKPWFSHVNDSTLEGIRHVTKPFQGVQFHPEAAAGPQDTSWILEQFVRKGLS